MDEVVRADPASPGAPPEVAAPGSATSPAQAPHRLDRRLRAPTLRVAMLLGATIIVATVLYLGRDALGPFILGLFLVYLFDPLVTLLGRRVRLPRWLACSEPIPTPSCTGTELKGRIASFRFIFGSAYP